MFAGHQPDEEAAMNMTNAQTLLKELSERGHVLTENIFYYGR
jgi:hypothetical protein